MQYGFIVTAGDPRTAAALAAEAEAAGWDGVFTWDGIAVGDVDTYDPWIVMAAMAMATERVRLGAILTPPARRRPWKLARETMTLDRLSNGRLVVPVGLGALDDKGFGNVGESVDARVRAERLDESLAILEGLWSGEAFGFEGRHYRFGPMAFAPSPVQRPRIPIWVAATLSSERSVARALRFDGIMPQTDDVEQVRTLAARVSRERPQEPGAPAAPFAITVEGRTTPGGTSVERVAALAAAGATWWIEADWSTPTVPRLRERIRTGPPRP
ncbi:MAG TPA: LLM class flavin-dependent oxidoreductase [Candidatus Limnocylindrales bacterium]|nr:LLM class flavin-dependent oxidoreductase [Candidatus Limnocylindrales bacterium]